MESPSFRRKTEEADFSTAKLPVPARNDVIFEKAQKNQGL
jgi:hypothetical protein